MYRYDSYDQAMVDARVADFRDQARRRLEGKLTEDQFKPLRLMNGLYLQLHAYMLRVAIPYGTLNARQMEALADIAEKYDRGYGHFTTRQNIQYNWIKLEDAADILADLAKVEMHAIQTSGNCIRNISADHFAGAAADEVVDPRPYAELMRQWSSFHPEFTYLPRKFKIAVIGSETDRAAMRLHDIGIRIVKRDGAVGAQFYAGGGMGRTPMIAPLIRDFVPLDQLITSARGRELMAAFASARNAFRDSLEALRAAGTELSRVTAIGGGSRSRYWLQSIATALGVPVDIPADGDFGAAFGAARLGLIAAEKADPLAVCRAPRTEVTVEPDRALAAAYNDAYQRYRALYPAIRGVS